MNWPSNPNNTVRTLPQVQRSQTFFLSVPGMPTHIALWLTCLWNSTKHSLCQVCLHCLLLGQLSATVIRQPALTCLCKPGVLSPRAEHTSEIPNEASQA